MPVPGTFLTAPVTTALEFEEEGAGQAQSLSADTTASSQHASAVSLRDARAAGESVPGTVSHSKSAPSKFGIGHAMAREIVSQSDSKSKTKTQTKPSRSAYRSEANEVARADTREL